MLQILRRKWNTFKELSMEERKERFSHYLRFKIPFYFFLFYTPFFLFLLRIFSQIKPIRVLTWRADRIGHQVADLELFLRKAQLEPLNYIPILVTHAPANKAFYHLAKKKLPILNSLPLCMALVRLIHLNRFQDVLSHFPPHRHPNLEFNSTSPAFELPQEWNERGKRLLQEMGINGPYVCFHARDEAYLGTRKSEADFSYHNFRNCSVESFLPAMEELVKRGHSVVRVGSHVEKKLKDVGCNNPQIIDYAAEWRARFGDEDWMDLFLLKNAHFFVGNTAGIFNVALIFNTPLICTNIVPLGEACSRSTDLFIMKKYWSKKEGRYLKFKEVISMGADLWGLASNYEKNSIEPHENSSQEITDVALEMLDRLSGKWQPLPDEEMLQASYRALWPKTHHINGYVSRVGTQFLIDNKGLL